MKDLLEIVKILTRKRISKIKILDERALRQRDSKFGELYEALATNKIQTDEDATRLLYGDEDASADRYRQIKSRFRRRLLNTLFFVNMNAPRTSSYTQTWFTVQKEWAMVQILLLHEAPYAATEMAKQLLSKALKFHFTELITQCATLLRSQAVQEQQVKDFQYYHHIVQQYMPILVAEQQAQWLCQQIQLACVNSVLSEAIATQVENWNNELLRLADSIESPVLQCAMYLGNTLYYENLREYEGVLEVCQNATAYLLEQGHRVDERKQRFYITKGIAAYLHLGDYRRGKVHAEQNLPYIPTESIAWLEYMEYYLLLSLRTKNYINALAVFKNVIASTVFKKINETEQQKWHLFEVFFRYLQETKQLSAELLSWKPRKSGRAEMVLPPFNETEQLSPAILAQWIVLQMLLLMQRRQFMALVKQGDQLFQLSNSELRQNKHTRTKSFVQLVQMLHKANYNTRKMGNIKKYLDAWEQRPFQYRRLMHDFEIIPYEQLWELLCRQADTL
jgi:hypothetical protein